MMWTVRLVVRFVVLAESPDLQRGRAHGWPRHVPLAVLVGACLGFLPYNFRPGDSGASFIGFTLARQAVMGKWTDDDPVVAPSRRSSSCVCRSSTSGS